MSNSLTLIGALALGLISSGHCLVMCGGITGALALATRTHARGGLRIDLLLGYQMGRIASYSMAGAALAGMGAAMVQWLDTDKVRIALRLADALLFALIGLSLLLRGRGFDFGLGRHAWLRIAPLARRFLPVRRFSQAVAFGLLWGWMPCGLVYSVLLIAWLSMDPGRSAAIMAMFGIGTTPAVLAGAIGAGKTLGFLGRAGPRSAVAIALLLFALLTVSGPWLAAHLGLHSFLWLPFDCVSP